MGMEMLFAGLQAAKEALELARGIKGGQVLEKHIELLREQIELQGKAQAENEEKLRHATQRVAELEKQVAEGFVEYCGALFRILPSGKLDFALYCPSCRVSGDPWTGYNCRRPECGWRSGIRSDEIAGALARVAAEYGREIAEPFFDPENRDAGPKERIQVVHRSTPLHLGGLTGF